MFLHAVHFSTEIFSCAEVSIVYYCEMSEFAQGLSELNVYVMNSGFLLICLAGQI
jgi:hypothetical protein